VSVAVVTVLHDSADDLRRLLASLPRVRVIAVDAGSSDDGPDVALAWGAEVVDAGDVGFGAANDLGVERVREDVTVLLNPDVVVLGDSLQRLVAVARSGGLHAPRLLNPDGTVQRSAHPRPGTAEALLPALVPPPLLPRPLRVRAEPWRADEPRRVGWAIAAALAAPTEALQALGPFDPEQFLFYEDLDLCLRAAHTGDRTTLHPGIAMLHRGGHSTGPAYGGEPFGLLARRRREVVRANLGPRAAALDDAAQALTFAARALAKPRSRRERAQLRALLAARRDGPAGRAAV
jgi:GT2 family glycosyltransferase